jgi:hypothetical protein
MDPTMILIGGFAAAIVGFYVICFAVCKFCEWMEERCKAERKALLLEALRRHQGEAYLLAELENL